MDYSGPQAIAIVEADLAMSDDEDLINIWPPLTTYNHHAQGNSPASGNSAPQPFTPAKRTLNEVSNNSSPPPSPAAKSSKKNPMTEPQAYDITPSPTPTPPISSYTSPSQAPAFAPREKYVKLTFPDNSSCDVKLRWLSNVAKSFRLDRELAEVKMSAITSRFVYVSRQRQDIIKSITSGEILSLRLVIQDSTERPRKFPTYLLTRYPVSIDASHAKEYPGIHTARRFVQNGTPINRLVITWSLLEPPPPTLEFPFLPFLPPCELRKMKDEIPWCYKCWGFKHISRYCSAPAKCAWCAENHDTRSCPHRPPTPPTTSDDSASTSEPSISPPPDTSRWKCPRCHKPGVNVWHGCTKRTPTATSQRLGPPLSSLPPPLPATSLTTPSTTDSAEVQALRQAVASLESRCSALTKRFDAIDARIESLVNQQATTATTLASLVESHKVVITSVTALTERLDTVASHLEKLSSPLNSSTHAPPGSAHIQTPTSSGSRKAHSNKIL